MLLVSDRADLSLDEVIPELLEVLTLLVVLVGVDLLIALTCEVSGLAGLGAFIA